VTPVEAPWEVPPPSPESTTAVVSHVTGFEVEGVTPPGATATVRAVEESTLGGGGAGLERSGDASQPHLVRGRGTVVLPAGMDVKAGSRVRGGRGVESQVLPFLPGQLSTIATKKGPHSSRLVGWGISSWWSRAADDHLEGGVHHNY